MEATFRITGKDFNEDLFKHIQTFFALKKDGEVTISFVGENRESKEAYTEKLKNSMEEAERGEVITFTMESLKSFVESPA